MSGGLVPAWSVVAILLLAALAANLPFLNERIFAVGPRRSPKSIWWRFVELSAYALIVALAGRGLESYLGQASALRWEFVAVWVCVMATLAFPGFVWRHLRRGT